MLYLIEDRDYLKIGYSKNLNERLKAYELHNCYAKLIDSKPGTQQDETNIQELCKDDLYKGEWFYNTPKIKQIFQEYQNINLDEIYQYKQYLTAKAQTILKYWNTFDIQLISDKYNEITPPDHLKTSKQRKDFEDKLSQLLNENYNYLQISDWYHYQRNQTVLFEMFFKNYYIKYDYFVLPNVVITRNMQKDFLEKLRNDLEEKLLQQKQIWNKNKELQMDSYYKELSLSLQQTIDCNIIKAKDKIEILEEKLKRLNYFLKANEIEK